MLKASVFRSCDEGAAHVGDARPGREKAICGNFIGSLLGWFGDWLFGSLPEFSKEEIDNG